MKEDAPIHNMTFSPNIHNVHLEDNVKCKDYVRGASLTFSKETFEKTIHFSFSLPGGITLCSECIESLGDPVITALKLGIL